MMMKAKRIGMLRMMPAGCLNDLPGAASRTLEAQPERHMTYGTNMYTLLDRAGVRPCGASRIHDHCRSAVAMEYD